MWERLTDYMRGSLTLARLALGYTSPNPAVGAVVVKNGVVVGMGHTQPPGAWHAEAMALQQAGPKAYGGILYVTLEPCCHYGRTPPCSEAIISAGISEVHVATMDPNPLVNGKGIEQLRRAGIKVVLGEMEEEAREVNEAYLKYIATAMPFVTVKMAMSLDGKIATRSGDSKWISGGESRKFVHALRHTVDAIMVGANTVICDDPRLTARFSSGRGGRSRVQPLRIIVDGKGRTSPSAQMFKEPGNTVLVVAPPIDQARTENYVQAGAEVLLMPPLVEGESQVDLEKLLRELGRRKITHVLVEGGGTLIGSLFDAGLVDKLVLFIAPIIVGGKEAACAVGGNGVERVSDSHNLKRIKVKRFAEDIMITGYVERPSSYGPAACSRV